MNSQQFKLILNLMQNADKVIQMAALKFMKSLVEINDEDLVQKLIELNAFDNVYEVLEKNIESENMLYSTVLSLINMIKVKSIYLAAEYLISKYYSEQEESAIN